MEIYTFQSLYNVVMNLIYALGAIALFVICFFLIRFFVGQVKAYHQSGEKFPRRLTVFLLRFALFRLLEQYYSGICSLRVFPMTLK